MLVLAANAIKQNELSQYILGKTNTKLKIASNEHLFHTSYCMHSLRSGYQSNCKIVALSTLIISQTAEHNCKCSSALQS